MESERDMESERSRPDSKSHSVDIPLNGELNDRSSESDEDVKVSGQETKENEPKTDEIEGLSANEGPKSDSIDDTNTDEVVNGNHNDTSDFDEESESSDSDSSTISIEPKLKYSRVSLPKPVFTTDPLSTCLVGESLLIFATHSGRLYFTTSDFKITRSLQAHKASILSLSTDGTYFASASIDGTIVIGSLTDEKDIMAVDFKRPIHSVALSPNYKSSKCYISGGMAGKVILSERRWLGSRSDTILYSGDNPIVSVHWIGNLIFWMNDDGISFYSYTSKSIILVIPRKQDSPQAALYKPRLCQPESNRIYIAWADSIWNLKITTSSSKDARGATLASSASSVLSVAVEQQKVSIESILHVDSLVAGIAPFGHDMILILSYVPKSPPTIRLFDIGGSGEEIYADQLPLRGYERLGLNDYQLAVQYERNSKPRYFILSATDGVVALERDLNDRLQWLLERNLNEDAWEMSANIIDPIKRHEIGLKWVEGLVEIEQWNDAAIALDRVLSELHGIGGGTTMSLRPSFSDSKSMESDPFAVDDTNRVEAILSQDWNRWGWIFVQAGHIEEIAPYLPVIPELNIDSSIYDAVLVHLIEKKPTVLVEYLNKWPVQLFSSSLIKSQLEDVLQDDKDSDLLRKALANLYIASGDPSPAIHHLLKMHDIGLLDVISKYHLFPSVIDILPDILTVGVSEPNISMIPIPILREKCFKAIDLVVEARHAVTPKTVVDKLMARKMDVITFLFLEHLNVVDPFASNAFGGLQVKLYAEFDRPKLLGFLKRNSNYNLENAVAICEKLNYIQELVYLLGKVGQNKKALRLVIEKLQDPQQAIEFTKAQHDADLWDDLITYSIQRPPFIRALLEHGGLDPINIIRRIPENLQIPGLKQALLKIFDEHEVVVSLKKGILDIVSTEAQKNAVALRAARTVGSVVEDEKLDLVDVSRALVLDTKGELHTENELIGDTNVWKASSSRTSARSGPRTGVTLKIQHLAYILKHMQA